MPAARHHIDYRGDRERLNLRITPDLKKSLAAYAVASNRSINDTASSIIELVLKAHDAKKPASKKR